MHTGCVPEPNVHCVPSERVAEYLIGIGYRPAQLGRTAMALQSREAFILDVLEALRDHEEAA